MGSAKKGIPEQMVRVVMSPYQGANTKVKVGTKSLEEFPVKLVGVSVITILVYNCCGCVVTKSTTFDV